jgi:putative acyl-CoA dehydrogenase
MSDAFLTLAWTDRGLTCFLVPRWRPDGTRNPFHIQRLKEKLGNRSNASSEIEYRGTFAQRVGEQGRGVRTIIEMVHHTRLDCVSGSAGLMRRALVEALHHTSQREAFGRRLDSQPLMRNVLADLALESEAATALMLRLARAYDEAPHDPKAMECLGGSGYVEESVLPRLYREAPVNAIWEGSGNVICLDVLRAAVREPDSVPAFLSELETTRGDDPRLDAWVAGLEAELAQPRQAEQRARRIVERMALGLQASLLVRDAPPELAEAFCRSRLDERGLGYGTLPPDVDTGAILTRAAVGTSAG